MDAAQLGQVQQQIHQELTAVRELVSVQQQQLVVLLQQQVQHAQQRSVASPANFTAKLPEFTGAGIVYLWGRDLDMLFAAKKCDPSSAYDWACTALKGVALQSLVTYQGGKEWEELKLFLLTRFKPLSFNVDCTITGNDVKCTKCVD